MPSRSHRCLHVQPKHYSTVMLNWGVYWFYSKNKPAICLGRDATFSQVAHWSHTLRNCSGKELLEFWILRISYKNRKTPMADFLSKQPPASYLSYLSYLILSYLQASSHSLERVKNEGRGRSTEIEHINYILIFFVL